MYGVVSGVRWVVYFGSKWCQVMYRGGVWCQGDELWGWGGVSSGGCMEVVSGTSIIVVQWYYSGNTYQCIHTLKIQEMHK